MKRTKKRETKLPWEHPKLEDEEPKAIELINTIKNSPTYKLAIEDSEFLESNETRGIRLELDYLKAELEIAKHGIEHTIVVFGSARIMEHQTAMQKLKVIQEKLDKKPEDRELLREFYIAERMVGKSIYYEDARRFGRLVGESGKSADDCKVVVMTGGGPGIMEAANRGSYDVGAKTIGLNIHLPHEQFPNPYITPDLCFQFHYFAVRKMHFLNRAKALVVYPGGFGTFDELFETLTLMQTRKTQNMPVVLVGRSYWEKAIDFAFLQEEGVIAPEDLDIFKFADNADEAWEHVLSWHKEKGSPLFD
ncbi:TIGR00730 family Rossman fold protein [Sulfurimonas paralvinellae]|uniref:AMP nucleosidase n=1 Tax=Sulfurimonas paralvinellae TaxID=317658 RepID=A0A7M1B7S0_9BACT|nr:TIGR00730 family Rossman fold protein [Sulfurimonas paralvinellae]QOP45789.1 TIGR00730 family Rossman fold protein [Sulfurimonas paralvinellae]